MLSTKFGRGVVLTSVAAALVASAATACDSSRDSSSEAKAPTSSQDCPTGQYDREFVGGKLEELHWYPLDDADRICISADEVTKVVSVQLPVLRKSIDDANRVLDENKVIIDEFVRKNYLSISDPHQRLLKLLKDNCGDGIKLGLKNPPVTAYPSYPVSEDSYRSSSLVGSVADVAKAIEAEYDAERHDPQGNVSGIYTPSDEGKFYGKEGYVDLASELEKVYDDAWGPAYQGVAPEYPGNYQPAIEKMCGTTHTVETRIHNYPYSPGSYSTAIPRPEG